jgi:hypothetical protein
LALDGLKFLLPKVGKQLVFWSHVSTLLIIFQFFLKRDGSMPEIELTKSAKKSLNLLYTAYKRRIKNEQKNSAVRFSRWEWQDVYDSVKTDIPELKGAGMVRVEIRTVILTPDAISFMEAKPRKFVSGIASAFGNAVSALFKFIP